MGRGPAYHGKGVKITWIEGQNAIGIWYTIGGGSQYF